MKKAISLLLAAALMLTMLALPAAAEETAGYEDTNGHWAQSQIDEWTENGVIGGYKDNTFKPDNGMKVSEFVTTMVNTLGLTEASTGNPFKDLDSNEWYAKNLLIAHKAGILLGDNKGRCNADSYINRERALVIMGRALKIEPVKNPNLSQFGDGAKVSDWAAPMMAALVERKIVQGTGKDMLAPQATINRASAITALNGAVTTYIHKPGDYQVEDGGIVLVNTTGDVSLSGELSSDLLVVPGASGSMITMDNLAVNGNVYVQAPDAALLIKNSEINGTVAVEETASGTVLDVGAGSTVNKLTTAADEVAVTGSGELKSAEVLGGDKVSIDTKGTEVSVDKNAGEVTAGGETVKPGESTTTDSKPENNKPSTTPAPSYTGTIGEAILHDESGAIADADLVQGYQVSKQAVSGYTKVIVSGRGLKYHQNGAGTDGYWIGFSLAAPDGVEQVDVAFSDAESQTLSGSPKPLAQEINENHDAGAAFYTNIGGSPEKHWALVQWYDAAGEKVGSEMKFYIDTTNVTIETGEGDITTDDGFTGTSVNDVLTFTGEIPYSTTKKGYLVNAVIDSADVKGFDKDTATYQIGGGTKTAWGDGTTVVVPMAVADDTATQTVTVKWNGKASNTQTFTMKLDEGVTWEIAEGAIEQDSGKTGGSGCNMTISGTTATVTGSIDWYAADATIGREEAGNRVGVKITAPSGFNTANTTVQFGNDSATNWTHIQDGDGTYFLWYPLVTQTTCSFTATIVWDTGMRPQTFTVAVNNATLNPEPATPPEPEVTATVVKNPPCDQSSNHLGNLVTGYNVTAGEVSNGVIPVTVSGTDLKYHQNAESKNGYWIGFGLEAPEGAEKVKYAFGAEKQDLNTLSGPVAFETNIDGVNGANSKGISFTANLLDAKPKVWAKVQWTKADGTPVTEEAVYQMDLSGVTCAGEGVITTKDDVKNVLELCDSVKFTYFDDNGIIEDLPEGAMVEYDKTSKTITLSGEVASGLPGKAPYTDDFKTAQFDPEVAKNGYTACSIYTGIQTNVTIEQTNPALGLYPEDIWIGIARNSEGVPVKTKGGYNFAVNGTYDLLLAGGMTEKNITVKFGSDIRNIVNNLTFKNTPSFTTENVLADGMNGVGISAAATTAETVDGVTHHTIAVTGTVTSGFGDNAGAKTLFNDAVVNSGVGSTKFTFCALKDLIPSGTKSTITQTNDALLFYGNHDATITDNVKSKLYDKTGPSPDCDYAILLREPDGGVPANVKIEIKNESGVLTDVYIITNHVTFS